MIKITTYQLSWSAAQNRGYVNLTLQNGQRASIEVDSAAELTALGDLLRSSHNIGFDPQAKALITDWVPPGSP